MADGLLGGGLAGEGHGARVPADGFSDRLGQDRGGPIIGGGAGEVAGEQRRLACPRLVVQRLS